MCEISVGGGGASVLGEEEGGGWRFRDVESLGWGVQDEVGGMAWDGMGWGLGWGWGWGMGNGEWEVWNRGGRGKDRV